MVLLVEPLGLPRFAGVAFALGFFIAPTVPFSGAPLIALLCGALGLGLNFLAVFLAVSFAIFDAIFLAILLPLNNKLVLWVQAHRPLRLTLV